MKIFYQRKTFLLKLKPNPKNVDRRNNKAYIEKSQIKKKKKKANSQHIIKNVRNVNLIEKT